MAYTFWRYFSSPLRTAKTALYFPAMFPCLPSKKGWYCWSNGSRSRKVPHCSSRSDHATQVSRVLMVSVVALLLSKQYSKNFALQTEPSVRQDPKVVTRKLRRLCASASSPWMTSGITKFKSTSLTTILKLKQLTQRVPGTKPHSMLPNLLQHKGTGSERIGWLRNHSVSLWVSQKACKA